MKEHKKKSKRYEDFEDSQSYRRQYEDERRKKKKEKKDKKQKKEKKEKKHHRERKHASREPQIKKDILKDEGQGWQLSQQKPVSPQIQKDQPMKKQQQSPRKNNQEQEKQEPNFEPSGILLQYYNSREGVSLKFYEPAQASRPTQQWRIYPFKQNSPMAPIMLKQSCYLVGKDQRICDILCENPSISRQHAVIQFREVHKMAADGTYFSEVKPYLMDLDSTNGTFLNNEKIQHSRYYQLLPKDMLKFGLSDREYVVYKVPEAGEAE